MNIKKPLLLKIVHEETLSHIGRLLEVDDPMVAVDADEDNKNKDAKKATDKDKQKQAKPGEQPKQQEPKKPNDMPSGESDLEADSKGHGIGDRISGLSVLSFTVEPEPKAGKTELVLQFKEDPDPLRIVIHPNGDVQFAYKGTLSRDLGGELA